MPETSSHEEFTHTHEDGLKNLEIEKGRLFEAKQQANLDPLDTTLMNTLTSLIVELSAAQERGPEEAFKVALNALNEVDAKRFIIENLLEGMKRDGNATVQPLLNRYQNLGLLPASAAANVSNANLLQGTIALVNRKSIWERVGIAVTQLVVNAIKSIPKFVEIEPGVTFVAGFPCLSFNLKGKGISCYEVLEALRKSVSAAWSNPK